MEASPLPGPSCFTPPQPRWAAEQAAAALGPLEGPADLLGGDWGPHHNARCVPSLSPGNPRSRPQRQDHVGGGCPLALRPETSLASVGPSFLCPAFSSPWHPGCAPPAVLARDHSRRCILVVPGLPNPREWSCHSRGAQGGRGAKADSAGPSVPHGCCAAQEEEPATRP